MSAAEADERLRPPFLRSVEFIAFSSGLVGIAIRLREYVFNRSLWVDEALLALNVTGRGLQITSVREQAAPIGFLTVIELATRAFGASEPVLRLLPLVAGIATIAVAYKLAVAYYDKQTAVAFVFLLSLSSLLIYYSTEFKQYGVDGFVGVCLLSQFHRFTAVDRRADYRWLGAVGALAILFSHPASLMLASVGVVLAAAAAHRRQWDRLARLAGCGALWLLIFAFVYRVNAGSAVSSSVMQAFHLPSFAPLAVSAATLRWYVNAIESFFMYALDPRLWLLCLVLFAVGTYSLSRRARPIVWLMASNVILLGIVSAMHLYPIHQRFLIYLYPLASLLIAVGAAPAIRSPAAATIVLFLVMLHPVLADRLRELMRPVGREETRELIDILLRQREPNDGLLVWGATTPAYLYYREVINNRPEDKDYTTIDGDLYQALSVADVNRAVAASGRSRFWVLASHMDAGGFGARNLRTLREALGSVANVEREWLRRDGFLWYYNLRPDDLRSGH